MCKAYHSHGSHGWPAVPCPCRCKTFKGRNIRKRLHMHTIQHQTTQEKVLYCPDLVESIVGYYYSRSGLQSKGLTCLLINRVFYLESVRRLWSGAPLDRLDKVESAERKQFYANLIQNLVFAYYSVNRAPNYKGFQFQNLRSLKVFSEVDEHILEGLQGCFGPNLLELKIYTSVPERFFEHLAKCVNLTTLCIQKPLSLERARMLEDHILTCRNLNSLTLHAMNTRLTEQENYDNEVLSAVSRSKSIHSFVGVYNWAVFETYLEGCSNFPALESLRIVEPPESPYQIKLLSNIAPLRSLKINVSNNADEILPVFPKALPELEKLELVISGFMDPAVFVRCGSVRLKHFKMEFCLGGYVRTLDDHDVASFTKLCPNLEELELKWRTPALTTDALLAALTTDALLAIGANCRCMRRLLLIPVINLCKPNSLELAMDSILDYEGECLFPNLEYFPAKLNSGNHRMLAQFYKTHLPKLEYQCGCLVCKVGKLVNIKYH